MMFGPDFDYVSEFSTRWDKKRRSLRLIGLIIGILMIVLGILCFIFPQKSLILLERLASIGILVLGIFLMIDYFSTLVYLRRPSTLINGIINTLIGLILLFSPAVLTIETFAFMFGFLMMTTGISKIAMARQISFFTQSGYGWVITTGIFNIIAAIIFIFAPLLSTIVINLILAAYLIVGGATIMVESLAMHDSEL